MESRLTVPDLPAPRISVVLALPDHRGQALKAIRSWTESQSLRAPEFEVIVVADGTEPALEAAVGQVLRPQDRLFVGNGPVLALTNLGAAAARGHWLLITESHVFADSECLSEMLQYCEANGLDGACCQSDGTNANAFAAMEQTMFETAFAQRSQLGGWNNIVIRGVGVRRAAFHAVGGFPTEFGHFGEIMLGARLKAQGYRLGCASKAKVSHFNTTTPQDLVGNLTEIGRGEILCRSLLPTEPCLAPLGSSPMWRRRELLRPQQSRPLLQMLGRICLAMLLSLRFTAVRCAGCEAVRYLATAVLGNRGVLVSSQVHLWLARLQVMFAPCTSRWYRQAYQRYWGCLLRYGRATAVHDYLVRSAANPTHPNEALDPICDVHLTWHPSATESPQPDWAEPIMMARWNSTYYDFAIHLDIALPQPVSADWECWAEVDLQRCAVTGISTPTMLRLVIPITARHQTAEGSHRLLLFLPELATPAQILHYRIESLHNASRSSSSVCRESARLTVAA